MIHGINNTIDISNYCNEYYNVPIYVPSLAVDDQRAIRHALNTLDIQFNDVSCQIKSNMNLNQIFLELIRYKLRIHGADYNSLWFKWIKVKLDEFYYRYTRRNLIYTFSHTKKSSHTIYKSIFQLYMYIWRYTSIFDQSTIDKGKQLDYFITAQLSAMCDARKGLLGAVTDKIFLYKHAVNNYLKFIHNNKLVAMVGNYHKYFYLTQFSGGRYKKSLYLADHESNVYTNFVVPLLQLKLPNIKNKSLEFLSNYLRTLEFALYREKLKNREHNKFIVSIEHLRTFTQLYKKVKGE